MEIKYIKIFCNYKSLYFKLGAIEDDVQEAFIKIDKAKPDFSNRPANQIKNYMIKSVMSCKLDRIKSSKNQRFINIDYGGTELQSDYTDFYNYQQDLLNQSYNDLVMNKFNRVYSLLDEKQKLYIDMRFFKNMTGKEISKHENISEQSVKGRMFRMKKYILKRYGKV